MNQPFIAGTPGRITRIRIFLLACAWMAACAATAAEPAVSQPGAKAPAAKRFGVVWRIRGEVTSTLGDAGNARTLRLGAPVFVGDHVRAAATGEAVLKTDDAGWLAIRPGAYFVPERYAADGQTTDHQTLRLITGAIRVIHGWIGHVNRPDVRVLTATVTIGIRGTDHEPYVLSAEMAAATSNREGTYDKVNRGSIAMGPDEQALVVPAGRVGFAPALPPAPEPGTIAPRGLLTLLLPVLMDKVPGFYVPGRFDAELDRLSRNAEAVSRKELERKQKTSPAAPATAAAPAKATPAAPAVAPSAAPAPTPGAPAATSALPAGCVPETIARDWLARFDGAIVRRDVKGIISLFAPEVVVRANVRRADGGTSSVNFGRDELAKSAVASVSRLTNYQQRRISLEATVETANTAASCSRVRMRSVSIEQGQQAGRPYRFEALEEYLLELRDGNWLAVTAETTQR